MSHSRLDELLKYYSAAYRFGRRQAQVDRIFRRWAASWLRPHGLSAMDWLILGIVCERARGLRPRDIAHELGLKPPLVTIVLRKLRRRSLLALQPLSTDRRSLLARPTEHGVQLIKDIEQTIRRQARPLFRETSMKDIVGYLRILEQVIENDQRWTARISPTQRT